MPKLIYASSKDSNMFYAVKHYIGDPFFYLDLDDKKYVFLDHREYDAFREANNNEKIEVVLLNSLIEEVIDISEKDPIKSSAYLILKKYNVFEKIIAVPYNIPLDLADFLRSKGVKLEIEKPFFPKREIKTNEESDIIKSNLQKNLKAFQGIEDILTDSKIVEGKIIYNDKILTSEILKKYVDEVLLEEDMMNVEGIIISSGLQTAIPHHSGSGEIKPNEPIICDIFPRNRFNNYFADTTRTYFKGEPSEKMKNIYQTVEQVQKFIISKIKPGEKLKNINDLCKKEFTRMGYHTGDKGFIHGTGHGVGLDIHEEPFINNSAEGVLKSGHIVTVEPGLYYSNLGGVRIEDIVCVTEDGCINLTDYSTEMKIF